MYAQEFNEYWVKLLVDQIRHNILRAMASFSLEHTGRGGGEKVTNLINYIQKVFQSSFFSQILSPNYQGTCPQSRRLNIIFKSDAVEAAHVSQ